MLILKRSKFKAGFVQSRPQALRQRNAETAPGIEQDRARRWFARFQPETRLLSPIPAVRLKLGARHPREKILFDCISSRLFPPVVFVISVVTEIIVCLGSVVKR